MFLHLPPCCASTPPLFRRPASQLVTCGSFFQGVRVALPHCCSVPSYLSCFILFRAFFHRSFDNSCFPHGSESREPVPGSVRSPEPPWTLTHTLTWMLPLVAIQSHVCPLVCMVSGQNLERLSPLGRRHLCSFCCDLKSNTKTNMRSFTFSEKGNLLFFSHLTRVLSGILGIGSEPCQRLPGGVHEGGAASGAHAAAGRGTT